MGNKVFALNLVICGLNAILILKYDVTNAQKMSFIFVIQSTNMG